MQMNVMTHGFTKALVLHHKKYMHDERVYGIGTGMMVCHDQFQWEMAIDGHPLPEKEQKSRIMAYVLGMLSAPTAELQQEGAQVRALSTGPDPL